MLPKGEGCCGSLPHHMGREARARAQMRANIDAWMREIDGAGLEAIVVTASGCGATIKDYGALLADDPAYADKAARVAALAKDSANFVDGLDLPFAAQAARRRLSCRLHVAARAEDHGGAKTLLRRAGFDVRMPSEAHLCCGSAGTYNILQPEMAEALRRARSPISSA